MAQILNHSAIVAGRLGDPLRFYIFKARNLLPLSDPCVQSSGDLERQLSQTLLVYVIFIPYGHLTETAPQISDWVIIALHETHLGLLHDLEIIFRSATPLARVEVRIDTGFGSTMTELCGENILSLLRALKDKNGFMKIWQGPARTFLTPQLKTKSLRVSQSASDLQRLPLTARQSLSPRKRTAASTEAAAPSKRSPVTQIVHGE